MDPTDPLDPADPTDLLHPTGSLSPTGLIGTRVPALAFAATDGTRVDLDRLGPGRSVLFLYPLTGRPSVDPPEGWDLIPGAKGCTAEACGFRDQHASLLRAGAARVYGLSAQSTGYQSELVHRLRLPYPVLADPQLTLARATGLPTFDAGGLTLYQRLTLVVLDGVIDHVFHPIPEPAGHATEVETWLQET